MHGMNVSSNVVNMKSKKSKIWYTVNYRILHGLGGISASSLGNSKLSDLHVKMDKLIDYAKRNDDKAVIFEQIIKTVETPIESKGSFFQFVPKFSPDVYYGEEKVNQEFYKPFKHRGSGR